MRSACGSLVALRPRLSAGLPLSWPLRARLHCVLANRIAAHDALSRLFHGNALEVGRQCLLISSGLIEHVAAVAVPGAPPRARPHSRAVVQAWPGSKQWPDFALDSDVTDATIAPTLTTERHMKVAAYHTNSPEYPPKHREVYHDKDTCPDGKQIKAVHRVDGTGAKKHCLVCDTVS